MTPWSVIASSLAVLACAGCASGRIAAPTLVDTPSGKLAVSTAALNQTFLFERADKDTIVCVAPMPDATFDQEFGLSLNLTLVDLGGGGGDDVGDEIEAGLGGRSPAVLIARELMYRACEAARNYGLSKTEYLDLYQKNLAAITQIGAAERVTVNENQQNAVPAVIGLAPLAAPSLSPGDGSAGGGLPFAPSPAPDLGGGAGSGSVSPQFGG